MKIAYAVIGAAHTPLKHFAKQLGIKYAVSAPLGHNQRYAPYANSWDYMILYPIKQDLNDFGMEWTVLEGVEFIEGAKLGLETKDRDIARFCTLIENCSRLGIKTVCYNWMPVWGWMRTRNNILLDGDARVTGFKMSDLAEAPDCDITISKDQLWTNLEYFLKKVVPVAERCKVQLAIHPDDPPVDSIAGVERILISADAMEAVTRLVPSEYNGITLCQGSFAAMGEDIPASIRRFGAAKTLFFAHFRDIIGTADDFYETFHFNGKTDMYEAMKCYYEFGYDGVMRPDHVPTMFGEANNMPGYAINGNLVAAGYMMGLIEAIEKELGYQSSK
jgi:mannonate dehydratase